MGSISTIQWKRPRVDLSSNTTQFDEATRRLTATHDLPRFKTLCRQETTYAVRAGVPRRGRSNHPGWPTVLLALVVSVFRLLFDATVTRHPSGTSRPVSLGRPAPRVIEREAKLLAPGDAAGGQHNRAQKWPGRSFNESATRSKPEFLDRTARNRRIRRGVRAGSASRRPICGHLGVLTGCKSATWPCACVRWNWVSTSFEPALLPAE